MPIKKQQTAELLQEVAISTTTPIELCETARNFGETIRERWELTPAADLLLRTIQEALTRAEQAGRLLDEQGLTFEKDGVYRAHPAVQIERDARNAVSLQAQKLMLSLEEVDD